MPAVREAGERRDRAVEKPRILPFLVSWFDGGRCSILEEKSFRPDTFSGVLLYFDRRKDAEVKVKKYREEKEMLFSAAGRRGPGIHSEARSRNHDYERFWREIRARVGESQEVVFDLETLPRDPVCPSLSFRDHARLLIQNQLKDADFYFGSYRAYCDLTRKNRDDERSFIFEGVEDDVMNQVRLAFRTSEPVLIVGETGIGKTRLAEYIHRSSMRKGRPFIPENVAGIPPSLFESRLFGIVEGAATGVPENPGLLELAAGGTLLLDEIGELNPKLQSKLLGVIQQDRSEASFFRVGSKARSTVDVRILAGTNLPVREALASGRFREDLFHRFSIVIELPTLRERAGRDPSILRHLFNAFHVDFKIRNLHTIDRDIEFEDMQACFELLARPHGPKDTNAWPGNIRQYSNFCRILLCDAYILNDGSPVRITRKMVERDLKQVMKYHGSGVPASPSPRSLRENEAEIVRRIENHQREAVRLAAEGGDFVVSRGARLYGVQDATFRKRMAEYGFQPKRGRG